MKNRLSILIRSLLVLFSLGVLTETLSSSDAFARAGSRRSMGKQAPSSQRAAPPPQQYNNPSQPQRGGFMKGLAGGIAGGFLGSMLFSSLGHAGTGAGGGGIGLLEIILLAGLGYLIYRIWKNRQLQTAGGARAGAGAAAGLGGASQWQKQWSPEPVHGTGNDSGAFAKSLGVATAMTSDEASDIFFRIQGAWTRRDLTSVKSMLGQDIARTLEDDLAALKRDQRINRLENISVRQVDVLESWQEAGEDLVRVRLLASLLDYTVDEASGKVLEGSDTEPVKFEEEWIFSRISAQREPWKLVGIQQV